MNKKLKQLSVRFPDLLSTYKTNWSPEPFDFVLQEEKTVIDIDTLESLSKNKDQILKKVRSANEHGFTVIRILDIFIFTHTNWVDKFVLKRANQFICLANEYDELIHQLLEKKDAKDVKDVKDVKDGNKDGNKDTKKTLLPDYSIKNLGELKDIARSLGIPKVYTYNKETKADLIKLIIEKEKEK
jgi:uncharacterized membrane-anchored protein